MRTVLFLMQKEVLQIRRNKIMLPLMLVMPVFQMVLLSFAANFEIKNLALSVVDHDHSPISRQLTEKFLASGYFKSDKPAFSNAEAMNQLAGDKVDVILEISPSFERRLVREGQASVSLKANSINSVKGGLALGYGGAIIRNYNAELLQWQVGLLPPDTTVRRPNVLDITYSNWYNPHLDYKTFMAPGILGEIVALIICFLTALNIVREREIGTIEQINVTPVKPWQFILGKLLPFWALSPIMMSLGLTIAKLIFDIPIEGPLWLIFVYTLTFAPCMLGLGFLISNYASTQQQAMFTAWFFMVIFILMCGLFTPVESMPQWAQYLNKVNPVMYFVEFMRLVLIKGAGFAEVKQNFFTVLAYAITINVLAVLSYRKRS